MRRHLLRRLAIAAPATSVSAAPTRGVYTTWEAVPLEAWASREPWLRRITNPSRYRGFEFWHAPEVAAPAGVPLSVVEKYLLSGIEDDTSRLLNISWTYDFDTFWHDRVASHEALYNILYKDRSFFYKFLFTDCSGNEAGRKYLEKKLNYLRSVLHWAAVTEQHYTAIAAARYTMQRDVWNALERERCLMGCVAAVESFRAMVPQEFAEKAVGELENHLVSMRHWVWDCPNAKRTFAQLA